jgi:glycosyltransferase involved in cell wall biosynthesis
MIVRNAEKYIRECLESVQGIVDEIHVADTGSTDSTLRIASERGARVILIPWENDFASARNRALQEVHTDWVLALDADELLDPCAHQHLPGLIDQPRVMGYLTSIRNYVLSPRERVWDQLSVPNDSRFEPAKEYPAYVEHQNVRLFRRSPEIVFVGRVHETVGSSIERSGGELRPCPLMIHHFGFAADPETKAQKNRLYREMGRQKLLDMPENAQAHFELGLLEFDNFHNYEEALRLFRRACELNPRLAVSWFFAGMSYLKLGQPEEALECLKSAGSRPTVCEAQGDAFYALGQFDHARRAYHGAFEGAKLPPDLESKIGLAEVRSSRVKKGVARLRKAVERHPSEPQLHDRLITALVWLGHLAEAAEAAEKKIETVKPDPQAYLRAAVIRAHQQDWQQSLEILRRGLAQFPHHQALEGILAEVLPRTSEQTSPVE